MCVTIIGMAKEGGFVSVDAREVAVAVSDIPSRIPPRAVCSSGGLSCRRLIPNLCERHPSVSSTGSGSASVYLAPPASACVRPGMSSRACVLGKVSYRCSTAKGLSTKFLSVFDLELPPDFKPYNGDGEVNIIAPPACDGFLRSGTAWVAVRCP